ncbi:unnamed protein product [Fusarium graminearum]|nr:hypothetical protein FG05_35119 [Fusarium graminearum]CZS79460.1 unnamed protein product [Fusarium graminearum]
MPGFAAKKRTVRDAQMRKGSRCTISA